MTEDINPLAPAEDATQDETEPGTGDAEEPEGEDEQAETPPAPAEPEVATVAEAPRSVDQRHPNPEHQAKLHEPTP